MPPDAKGEGTKMMKKLNYLLILFFILMFHFDMILKHMFPNKFMRFNFEAKNMPSYYESYLYYFLLKF